MSPVLVSLLPHPLEKIKGRKLDVPLTILQKMQAADDIFAALLEAMVGKREVGVRLGRVWGELNRGVGWRRG
jgi:hypothetical protein